MSELTEWVKTPIAVQRTGRSRSQLMRLVDKGYLVRGTHWMKGPTEKSPITWDVSAIEKLLATHNSLPSPSSQIKSLVSLTETHENV